jgi:hypothetical protein
MNGGPQFTRDEILQAARSLTGKPSTLNHDCANPFSLKEVEVVAAQFEEHCVECLFQRRFWARVFPADNDVKFR